MQLTPHLARAADLVRVFEPFKPNAVRRPDGDGWAIGYGHIRTAREGAQVSRSDGAALLIYDLIQAAELVDREVRVELDDAQRSALIAFAFTVGQDAFSDGAVVRRLNDADLAGAAGEMERWGRSDLTGAFRRRDTLSPGDDANPCEPHAALTNTPTTPTRSLVRAWGWPTILGIGIGGVGLVLFGLSVVMILSGRLDVANLVVGLFGVLLMIPMTYVSFGRTRRS